MEELAPTTADWAKWTQDVLTMGLAKKWDAEYVKPFETNAQVPPSAPATTAAQRVPGWALGLGAAVLVLGAAWAFTRD